MTEIITQSIQDYLKHIYELNEHGGPASTNDLAARLNIAPASVTGMIQRLANSQPPLVVYKKHQGVTLTKSGEKAALEVIRHHRLLETFRDPHGELIPTVDLTMPADESCPLASLRTDETATVRRVSDDDPALLRHLREIGVVPEVKIVVKNYSEFDGNLTLQVEGQKLNVVLGTAVTNHVFVDK